MAARGSESKEKVINKIKEVFPDVFIGSDGKTLRIPLVEGGEPIEIKVALTAAKDLEGGGNIASGDNELASVTPKVAATVAEPTQEELDRVNSLLKKLSF